MIANRFRPRWLILENVPGIYANGQDQEIVKKLRAIKYTCVILDSSPTDWGWPHRRDRVFFLAVSLDVLISAGWSQERFEQKARVLLERFRTFRKWQMVDLDQILMPEGHPVVSRTRDDALAANPSLQCIGKHMAGPRSISRKMDLEKAVAGSHWRPEVGKLFPTFLMLPERERTLLDQGNCSFPERERRVWNLSQSYATTLCDIVPCLTPSACYWVLWP